MTDVHETVSSRKRLLQNASLTALLPVERLTVAEQICIQAHLVALCTEVVKANKLSNQA